MSRSAQPWSIAGGVARHFASGLAVAGLLLTAPGAREQSPLVDELRRVAVSYHEDPSQLFRIRDQLEAAITSDEHVENLNALAWVCYIIGDLPDSTRAQKLAAYDRGRQVAKRVIEKEPRNVGGHFWYAVNTGRWGQTNGILRSLFLLPTVKREMETVLELDPSFTPVYNLAGHVYYEVPGLLGGDLDRAEALFRKGLAQDPKDTAIRLGLAKTLIKKNRIADARRELQAILDEQAPHNLADWVLKDSKEARALLESINARS
jgi:tetratricopeptide (TPR) repeat protein